MTRLVASASHPVIAIQIEVVEQRIAVALTSNGSEVFIAAMVDGPCVVAVTYGCIVFTVVFYYFTHDAAHLFVAIYIGIAIAVFYQALVVVCPSADGSYTVIVIDIPALYSATYDRTVGYNAVVLHSRTKCSDIAILIVIACTDDGVL